MNDNQFISVVIPVFNEEESLKKLFAEIHQVIAQYNDWEVIFVDDGSDDNSFKVLKNIVDNNIGTSVIRLYKNYDLSKIKNNCCKVNKNNGNDKIIKK